MNKLVIILNPDKTLNVSGPLSDRLLCYAMLQSALDVVRDWRPPDIIPASEIAGERISTSRQTVKL